MLKSLLLLSVLSANALASYLVVTINSGKTASHGFSLDSGRVCYCVKNTQTDYIGGVYGGDIKLFWSSDCTGNYDTLGSSSSIQGATWVNSFSMGQSGIKSSGPNGCPNYYLQ